MSIGVAFTHGECRSVSFGWDMGTRSNGNNSYVLKCDGEERKGFVVNSKCIVIAAGSCAMIQDLGLFAKAKPAIPEYDLLSPSWIKFFANTFRVWLESQGGYHFSDSENPPSCILPELEMLFVSSQGQIMSYDEHHVVDHTNRGYGVVGCGSPFALGAIYGRTYCSHEAWSDDFVSVTVQAALDAAGRFDANCATLNCLYSIQKGVAIEAGMFD